MKLNMQKPETVASAATAAAVAGYLALNSISGVSMWHTLGGGAWGYLSGGIIFGVFSAASFAAVKTLRGGVQIKRKALAGAVLTACFAVDFVALKHEATSWGLKTFAAVELQRAGSEADSSRTAAISAAQKAIAECQRRYPGAKKYAPARADCVKPHQLILTTLPLAINQTVTATDLGEVKSWQPIADSLNSWTSKTWTAEAAMNAYTITSLLVLGLSTLFAATYKPEDEFSAGWAWTRHGTPEAKSLSSPALSGPALASGYPTSGVLSALQSFGDGQNKAQAARNKTHHMMANLAGQLGDAIDQITRHTPPIPPTTTNLTEPDLTSKPDLTNLAGQVIRSGVDKNQPDRPVDLIDLELQLKQAKEAAAKAEADRLEQVRLTQQAEADRIAAVRLAEEAAAKAEADRLEQVRLTQQAEADRIAAVRLAEEAAAKAEADRLEQVRLTQQAEADRIAAVRLAEEAAAKAEADRLEQVRLAEIERERNGLTSEQIAVAIAVITGVAKASKAGAGLGRATLAQAFKNAGLPTSTEAIKTLIKIGCGQLAEQGELVIRHPNPGSGKPEFIVA